MPLAAGSAREAPSRRRQSKLVRWLLILIVLAAATLATLNYLLDPARLGAWLLQRAEAETGLKLHSERAAKLHLWPGLQLSIDQLSVGRAAAPPFASIGELRIRVPLQALWSEWEVEEIRAHQVVFDWQRYQQIDEQTAAVEQIGPPRPWIVPTFRYIELRDVQLRSAEQSMQIERAELTPLSSGELNQLQVVGHLQPDDKLSVPFELLARAELSTERGDLDLGHLQLQLSANSSPVAEAEGRLRIDPAGQIDLTLQATFNSWPAAWPTRTALLREGSESGELPLLSEQEWNDLLGQVSFDRAGLNYIGDLAANGSLELQLDGPERQVQLNARLQELIQWWNSEAARQQPPPIELRVALKTLQLKEQQLQGIKIEPIPGSDDDANPSPDAEAEPGHSKGGR